jgi:hypothetical protein
MARRLRGAAGNGHIPGHDSMIRMIYRWERSTTGLGERYELLYARALGIPADDLSGGPLPSSLSSLMFPTDREDGDGPVNRREFAVTAAGMLAGGFVPPARIPASVSPEHVRELKRIATGLWTGEREVGGSALLRDARAHYATARALLDNGRYTSAVGADLQAVTAELGAGAGFIAFDAAEQRLARSLLTEAAMLAGGPGDPLVTALSYSLLAVQSAHLATSAGDARTGLAREALRYLDYAVAAARHEASAKVHVIIAMRRARAYGLLGDQREARAHIAVAMRELDRGVQARDPHWTAFVIGAEVTAHEAMACLALGQAATAADLYRDVLTDPGLPARNRALYQASLAGALATAGDQSQATAEGMVVLPILEGPVKSVRTLNHLRPVRQRESDDSEFAVRFDTVAAAA